MREEIKSGQAEMRSTLDALLMDLNDGRNETKACNGATETELDPGMMQPIEEHQEIPKGEATVMPVREPRKQRRVCNLATDPHQTRTVRTQGNCIFRRKLAATCRKVSRHAKVAWRKRNLFRNAQTQRNCGLRKRLTVTGRNTTRRATVAWHSENVARKDWTRASVVQENQRERTFGRKTAKSIGGRRRRQQPRLETMGNDNKLFRKIMGLEFGKRAFRISSGIRRRRDWSLRKDRRLGNEMRNSGWSGSRYCRSTGH
jgi:hypothetical protein